MKVIGDYFKSNHKGYSYLFFSSTAAIIYKNFWKSEISHLPQLNSWPLAIMWLFGLIYPIGFSFGFFIASMALIKSPFKRKFEKILFYSFHIIFYGMIIISAAS